MENKQVDKILSKLASTRVKLSHNDAMTKNSFRPEADFEINCSRCIEELDTEFRLLEKQIRDNDPDVTRVVMWPIKDGLVLVYLESSVATWNLFHTHTKLRIWGRERFSLVRRMLALSLDFDWSFKQYKNANVEAMQVMRGAIAYYDYMHPKYLIFSSSNSIIHKALEVFEKYLLEKFSAWCLLKETIENSTEKQAEDTTPILLDTPLKKDSSKGRTLLIKRSK